MGSFTSIRGWIEVHDKSLDLIHEVLKSHQDKASDFQLTVDNAKFYNQGWLIPEQCINWTHYIFYGADVRTQYVDFIRSEMEAIAALYFTDGSIDEDWGYHPTGVIHVHEDGTFEYPDEVWTIDGGKMTSEQVIRKES